MTTSLGYNDYNVYWQDNSTILCFISGILLAVLVASRTLLFGKVTGISGILSDTITFKEVKGYDRHKSMMYIGGMLCGGAIAKEYLPAWYYYHHY